MKTKVKGAKVAPRNEELAMLSGIQGCDVVVFVGYHGRAGGANFLAHTVSGKWIKKITVNDVEVSEGSLNAAVARKFGTKLVLFSGTDAGVEEMREEIPSVHYVTATESKDEWTGVPLHEPEDFCK